MRLPLPMSLLGALGLTLLWGTIALAQTAGAQDFIKRGNAKYVKAEYDSAIAEYRRISPAAGDTYAQALYNIGVCYYELGRTEEAIRLYREAIKVRPEYAKALYALGVALGDFGKHEEARAAYQSAVAASGGKYAVAYFKLGVLAAADGEYDAAAMLFREAISKSSDRLPSSHNNLGVMLALRGKFNEAEREFRIALKQTDGTFADAKHNLTLCRSLSSALAKAQVGSLKIVESPAARMQ